MHSRCYMCPPNERRYLSGAALGGRFAYYTIMFGVGSGPLLWGRVAAWAMRSTQALFGGGNVRARVNCFVDDPLIAFMGTPRRWRRP